MFLVLTGLSSGKYMNVMQKIIEGFYTVKLHGLKTWFTSVRQTNMLKTLLLCSDKRIFLLNP
jgi:hypothetical protein